MTTMERRDFLKWLGVGTLTGVAAPALCASCATGDDVPSSLPAGAQSSFAADVELDVRAVAKEVQILPGAPTRVWTYTGTVLKGPAETLQVLPDSYLGPTVRVHTGQKVRIRFTNLLPEPTIVHWHGLHVPAAMDGHPRSAITRNRTFVYEFEVVNRAGTYWYHPHHHNRTGPQVYSGLAGLFIVSDGSEAALGLPSDGEEICCVLQDRSFDRDNQLVYDAGMMMAQMTGVLGDRILVNGREHPTLRLSTRAYRLRFLNGSNSRIYKLAWDDETPMTLVGTDGGLLEHPIMRRYVTLAPGERADTILDLARHRVGTSLTLRSVAYAGGAPGMGMGMGMGRMMMGAGNARADGSPLSILTVGVERRDASSFQVPARLSTFDATWHAETSGRPARVIPLTSGGMRWLLNDRAFEMEGVAPNEIVSLGASDVWELANLGGGMMGMAMAHPIHLHGRQFRVVDRQIDPRLEGEWGSLRDGFTDEGWKDTVLVMPGERVRLLTSFTRYPGLFLYHCHNLEHEDMGMMRNYRVTG